MTQNGHAAAAQAQAASERKRPQQSCHFTKVVRRKLRESYTQQIYSNRKWITARPEVSPKKFLTFREYILKWAHATCPFG